MRFDSRIKHRIISFLFWQPRRSFSLNELAVRAGSSVSRVNAVLREFVKQRLVGVAGRRQLRCYQINRRSSDWEGLEHLMRSSSRSSRGQDPVERLISSLPRLKFAALAGIYIGRPVASADILLVGDVSETRLQRTVRALEELLGGEINYALFSEAEFHERLYSYDWFVKEVMDHDPIILLDHLKYHPAKAEKYLKAVFSKVND